MCHIGTNILVMPLASPTTSTKPAIASDLQRLREAQDDHDVVRRAFFDGVTTALLSADHRRWEALGEAIAELAAVITRHCGSSHFCDARPDTVLLALRLAESVDDLMDEPAWSVVEAATRLAVIQKRGGPDPLAGGKDPGRTADRPDL